MVPLSGLRLRVLLSSVLVKALCKAEKKITAVKSVEVSCCLLKGREPEGVT